MSEKKDVNVSGWTIFYVILALVIGIWVLIGGMAGHGFFVRIIGAIVASIFAFCGALIGDFLRKVAMPDTIMTSGMTDTLKQRLFWFIGPQVIGELIGGVLGGGIVRAIFGG